ncbi:phosphate ABC transporter permease family protein, partial [Brevundimonas vesicularis]|uniref:phosphate ABC transporter permease family protein n=1 Tax=Brevundimonas vesicularis TaxID=41276 RepID=UPI0028A85483
MIWIYLLILVALSAAAFLGGRTLARRRAIGAKPHSRPGQHGAYALIWGTAPALLVLILASVFAAPLQRQLTAVGTPDAVAALEPFRRDAFFADAHRVGRGEAALQIWERPLAEQLPVEARRMVRIERTLSWGGGVAAILAAILGGLFALTQIKPQTRARNRVEGWIYGALFVCSAIAVLTTLGIIASLAFDSFRFFQKVPVLDFLFGTQWSPQIAIRADQVGSSGAFGAVPLFAGTLLIMVIAMCVAAPNGLLSA